MDFDVIVAGGGPGGSTTATFLARKGYKVGLFEKERFPRDKVCGDAISGKSVRVLDRLGLLDEVEAAPMALAYGVRFTSPDQTELVVPFPKPSASADRQASGKTHNEPGYVCRREVYDNIVFQCAKRESNVTIFEETPVKDVLRDDAGMVNGIMTQDGRQFHAKVVVGAGGAMCPVSRAVGSSDKDDKHWCAALRVYYENVKDVDENIEIHFVDDIIPGYFWIFPLENGMANVGIGMRQDYIKRDKADLKEALRRTIEDNPLFSERFEGAKVVEDSLRAWKLPLGSKRRPISGDGWLTVGDAAGLVDPFSGEGIGNAMVAGSIAAEVIDEALTGPGPTATKLSEYDGRLWAEIGEELDRSYKLQRLGRYKFLLNFVVNKAARSPQLQARLSEMLSDRDDTSELTDFRFYASLLFK